MNQYKQRGGSSRDVHRRQAVQARHAAQPTTFSNIWLPNVALHQGAQIDRPLNEISASEKALNGHHWSRPSMGGCGCVGPSDQCWSTNGVYQNCEGRWLDVNGSSIFPRSEQSLGHNLEDQHSASPTTFDFRSQLLQSQHFSNQQPIKMADFWQQSLKTDLPKATEPGITTNHFGLLTPAPTDAQNSPPDDAVGRVINNSESRAQHVWDHNFDATPLANNTSDASTAHMFPNNCAAPSERQLWNDIDFDFLDGLFGVSDTTMLNGSSAGLDAAAPGKDMQLTSHHGGPVPHPSPLQLFDPVLTDINYSCPDSVGISSDPTTPYQSIHPACVGQKAAYYSAPPLRGPANALDTPSSANSVPRTLAKPPQRENAKNTLLIHYKEQGMSYKDIKALGGFDEAESTLRGRYRTLTKPKEERVRKPEWSDRDVFLLFEAVGHFTRAHSQSQRLSSSRGISARRRGAEKIPWKQVSEYMADRGTYKYGYGTVKRKYEEINRAHKERNEVGR